MWRPVLVATAAAEEPLATADLKAHLRVDDEDSDALIAAYAATARAHVEAITGTRLVTQTLTLKASDWADLAQLPVAPLSEVDGIVYFDTAGDAQTLATSVYEARLDGLEPSIVLKSGQVWPTILPGTLIVLTVTAGYGAAGAQPAELLHAIKLIVGDLFAFRETAQVGSVAGKIPVSATVEALLANHRKFLI